MVVHSYYLDDTRVRREAEALVSVGMNVDVVCLNKGGEAPLEEFCGVNIHRCNVSRSKKRSKFTYVVEYVRFFLKAFFKAAKLSLYNKYDAFFAHNMPNFLIFTGLLAKLKGAKLVLDMHDSMPELYQNLFALNEGLFLKFLRFEERISVMLANRCMTANLPIADILESRNKTSFFVIHNTPDLTVLSFEKRLNHENEKLKLFHHGNIHQRYGLDRVLPILKKLNDDKNCYQLDVHGRGPWYDTVKKIAKDLEVDEYCRFYPGFKPQDIGKELSKADIGLVLNHKNDLTDLLLPVKMLEYISCRIPVICPRTKAIEYYFDDSSVYFFDAEEEIIELIESIRLNSKNAALRAEKAFLVYRDIAWQFEKVKFVKFVESL